MTTHRGATERPSEGVGIAETASSTAKTHSLPDSLDVLYKIEQETGVSAKHLYAICMVESRCYSDVVGDSGKAIGAFQIRYDYNPESKGMANDFEWSARWTANYLLKNGYKDDVWRAVVCHNGCGFENGYLEKINQYL